MFRWLLNFFRQLTAPPSDFEQAFSKLRHFARQGDSEKRIYELLAQLNHQSSKADVDELTTLVQDLPFSSNSNGVFYFFFPIVSHILFYQPSYEKKLLGIIIGPNFANGDTDLAGVMKIIPGAMHYKLKENPKYLTPESQQWILNTFPTMHQEVQRELNILWKELDD